MNGADIVGVSLIVTFAALGYFMGTIRSLASMLGVIAAFKVADRLFANQATQNAYTWAFIGVFLGFTIVGILFYGKTRTTVLDALEGIIGAIMGIVTGWGVARFVFSVALFYKKDSEFAQLVASGMISMDIYLISPLAFMMNSTTSLRDPHPFD
ncbi:MAG: hypothetical protein WCX65_19125 [bacterium]